MNTTAPVNEGAAAPPQPTGVPAALVDRRKKPRHRFGLGTPKQFTAIDIDGRVVRVAQTVRKGGRTIVKRLAAERLPASDELDPSNPQALGAWLSAALSRLRIKPGVVVMGVPRGQVVLKPLTLPVAADLGELASMVHFQVGKDLPFKLEEAVIDFTIQSHFDPAAGQASDPDEEGEDEANPSAQQVSVLVAAVKKEVVGYYEAVASAAGLRLASVGLRSYANVRCVQACRIYEGSEGVGLISLRPDEVIIDVLVDHALAFSRVASAKIAPPGQSADGTGEGAEGAAPPSPAPETIGVSPAAPEAPARTETQRLIDAVSTEVVRSLHSYSGMESHRQVAKVVVAGDTGNEQAVVEALAKRLTVPVKLLDPATALGFSGPERMHAPASIAAIGLAIGVHEPQGLPFDFLNPKRPTVQRDPRRLRMLLAAAAVVALGTMGFAARQHFLNAKLSERQDVAKKLAELQAQEKLYKRIQYQGRALDEWSSAARPWLAHYAYLSAMLPDSEHVYLTGLSMTPRGTIQLSVKARDGGILVELDKRLRAAGYGVKPLPATPTADKYGYPFSTTVELTAPADMKIDMEKVVAPGRPADDASLDGVSSRGDDSSGSRTREERSAES